MMKNKDYAALLTKKQYLSEEERLDKAIKYVQEKIQETTELILQRKKDIKDIQIYANGLLREADYALSKKYALSIGMLRDEVTDTYRLLISKHKLMTDFSKVGWLSIDGTMHDGPTRDVQSFKVRERYGSSYVNPSGIAVARNLSFEPSYILEGANADDSNEQ